MLATPPGSPSVSSRRNLDHAFPPFAMGLPSVYERAGFDVNKSRSRSGSASSSMRSRSSSREGSRNNSIKSSQLAFGAPLANKSSSSLGSNKLGGSSASLDKPSPLVSEQFNKYKQPSSEPQPIIEEEQPASIASASLGSPALQSSENVAPAPASAPNNIATIQQIAQQEEALEHQGEPHNEPFHNPYMVDSQPAQTKQFQLSDDEDDVSIYSEIGVVPPSDQPKPAPPPHLSPLKISEPREQPGDRLMGAAPLADTSQSDFKFDDSVSEMTVQEPHDGLQTLPSHESTTHDISAVRPLDLHGHDGSPPALLPPVPPQHAQHAQHVHSQHEEHEEALRQHGGHFEDQRGLNGPDVHKTEPQRGLNEHEVHYRDQHREFNQPDSHYEDQHKEDNEPAVNFQGESRDSKEPHVNFMDQREKQPEELSAFPDELAPGKAAPVMAGAMSQHASGPITPVSLDHVGMIPPPPQMLSQMPPQGIPPQEMPSEGMPPREMSSEVVPSEEKPSRGVPPEEMHSEGVPPQGMPLHGMPPQEMPPQGMPLHGMSSQGMPPHGMPPQGKSPQGKSPQGMPPHGMSPQMMSPKMMSPQLGMPPMSPRGAQPMPQHSFMPQHQPNLFNPQFAARPPMAPPMQFPPMNMPQHAPLHHSPGAHASNADVFMQPKQRFPRGNNSPKLGPSLSPSVSASGFDNPGMPGRKRLPGPQQGAAPPMGPPQVMPTLPLSQGKRGNTRALIGAAHNAGDMTMNPPPASRRMPPQGMPPQGMPPQGMRPGMPMPMPMQGMPMQGMRPGMPPPGFVPQGFPPQGFPPHGFPPQGHPHQGFPPQGFPPQGFPPQGFPPQGFPPQGFPPQGFPPQGFPPQGMRPGMQQMPPPNGPAARSAQLAAPNADSDSSPNTSRSQSSAATSEMEVDKIAQQQQPKAPSGNMLTVPERRMSNSSSIYSAHQNAMMNKHNAEPSQGSSVSFDFNQAHLTATECAANAPRSNASNRVSTWYSADDSNSLDGESPTGHHNTAELPPKPGAISTVTTSDSMQDLHSTIPANGKQRKQCRGCMLPITGKSVRAQQGSLTGRWHRDCFKCVRCDQGLAVMGEIHVLNDQPFCSSCYHIANNSNCRLCGEGIEGSCLETRLDLGDQPLLYHVNCLRCAQCNMKLQHSYFDVGGQTFCAEHAFTSLPDDKDVHKRYTQFKMI